MATPGQFSLDEYLDGTLRTVADSVTNEAFRSAVAEASELCIAALRAGGKVLLAGNGGSAADAQHLAGEFLSRFMFDRPGLPAIALTTDTSVLTAIGNDYGYEHVFARQVEALGRPGDVFVAISTSGRSPNILKAMEAARTRGVKIVALVGCSGHEMAGLADVAVIATCPETPYVQQVHIIAGHAICAAVEAALFERVDPA